MKKKNNTSNVVKDGLKTYQKSAIFGNVKAKTVHKSHKAYCRKSKHKEDLRYAV